LNVLTTIAKHNSESIIDITEKVLRLSKDPHWEIQVQCLEFAVTVLHGHKHMGHLLSQKDDGKGKKDALSVGGGEKNSLKSNLGLCVDIIKSSFNPESPKSV
jgi:hypothetical protein